MIVKGISRGGFRIKNLDLQFELQITNANFTALPKILKIYRIPINQIYKLSALAFSKA
jgi:hypothetical protein